jgi:hypothetical protein
MPTLKEKIPVERMVGAALGGFTASLLIAWLRHDWAEFPVRAGSLALGCTIGAAVGYRFNKKNQGPPKPETHENGRHPV